MELKTPQDYIEAARRHKWYIIIPFVLVMIASVGVYKRLPKIYSATTLILVQPQKVPTSYVQSTVTLSVTDRLATISQQILSRTSLEKVIKELNLVADFSDPLLVERKVESMRKAIKVDVRGGRQYGESTSSFSIAFEDQNPVDASRIVNKVASLFITENLKVREEQARGTSEFLENELVEVENRLKQKEEEIRRFKELYMGELPAQLDANLRILERLQQQIQTNNESLISVYQRKVNLDNQIDQVGQTGFYTLTDQGAVAQDPLMAELNNQKRRLQELQTQYTDKHPDVITAKLSIEKLEAQISERGKETTAVPQKETAIYDPTLRRLKVELQDVLAQIGRLEREQANLRKQIALYQGRVENVPKREEEISTLTRDYALLQENYQSLLDKKIQAQLAENLERRQKGEQFKILDPAKPPVYPVKPDKRKVFGLAFLLGFGLGGGLAFLREQADRSFYKVDDVEKSLGFQVIATIPRIETPKTGSS